MHWAPGHTGAPFSTEQGAWHGRLFRDHRSAGGGMARALGLIFVALLVLVSQSARAATTDTREQAAAKCEVKRTSLQGQYPGSTIPACKDTSPEMTQGTGSWKVTFAGQTWAYQYIVLPCADREAYPASYGSNISVCRSGCMYKPDEDAEHWSVTGNGGAFRASKTTGMYRPTGAVCPADQPEPPRAEGKLCGGGSCYDTATNNFCAVDSAGAQTCVKGPPPGGGGGGGGCASSGDTTLCVGSPPPMPPNPPVADPVADIGSSDKFGHQSGNGPINNTTVNNYNSSGGAPNSGAGAGDTAPPAAGGGTGGDGGTGDGDDGKDGDGTSASGGGDCNTPPICEGSAATCMVVTQTWLLRCPPGAKGDEGDGEGDGEGGVVPGLEGIGTAPGAGFMREETLLDKLKVDGFGGGGQCPQLIDLHLADYGIDFDGSSLPWCDILEKAGYVIMLLAAFVSYRILSEK